VTEGHRDRFVVSSLIEEAITSSQLEGASTTRVVAKDMLRSGRAPERVGIYDERNRLLHRPPRAEELPDRLDRMCAFARGELDDGWLHPVVRAITLHFWIAHDHPFEDGNGRTARALFYWSMLNQGDWLSEFLAISPIIKRARGQYERAFLYAETDDNDLTYFLLHQLRVIIKSIEALHAYLDRKTREIGEAEALLRRSPRLNYRQLSLVSQRRSVQPSSFAPH
jgi:Fic family protein